MVYWNLPRENSFKCNTDGASKGNLGARSAAFYVRNDQGDLIHAEGKVIGVANNLVVEIVALRLGLEFCRNHNLFPLVMETDSLAAKNMIDGLWNFPWEVALEIRRIQVLNEGLEVAVEHSLREGNKLEDFMASFVFSFAGTEKISFISFQDLPDEAKTLLNMDKRKILI